MRIKTFVSRGEVFMHEDGTFEVAPFQVFRSSSGGVCIRIGRNCYFFSKDGSYDGPECKPPPTVDIDGLRAALQACTKNRGRRPAEPYFQQGSPGFMAEVKSWPSDDAEPEQEELHGYDFVSKPGEKN
jgi:hypothetical protein